MEEAHLEFEVLRPSWQGSQEKKLVDHVTSITRTANIAFSGAKADSSPEEYAAKSEILGCRATMR